MDAIKCMKSRRSIRKYLKKPVSDNLVKELIDCARCAPTSSNCQNWEFVIVRENSIKKELSQIHKWSNFVKDANIVLAVCYDKDKYAFCPSAIINGALAAQNILLAAHAFGLGACWVFVKDDDVKEIEARVKEILNIPNNIDVVCMLGIGYPDEKPETKKLRDLDEITHLEKWNK